MSDNDIDYILGQVKLIKHIQKELEKALNKAEGVDLALDVITILKNLRPLPKSTEEK